jgi:hypothetical protein
VTPARNCYFPRWLEWLPEIHIEGRPELPPEAINATDEEEERVPALV